MWLSTNNVFGDIPFEDGTYQYHVEVIFIISLFTRYIYSKSDETIIAETKITDIDHRKSFGDLYFGNLYFDDLHFDDVTCDDELTYRDF